MNTAQIVLTVTVSVAAALILVLLIVEIQRLRRSAQALGAPKENPSQI
jgi:hypothetical protein